MRSEQMRAVLRIVTMCSLWIFSACSQDDTAILKTESAFLLDRNQIPAEHPQTRGMPRVIVTPEGHYVLIDNGGKQHLLETVNDLRLEKTHKSDKPDQLPNPEIVADIISDFLVSMRYEHHPEYLDLPEHPLIQTQMKLGPPPWSPPYPDLGGCGKKFGPANGYTVLFFPAFENRLIGGAPPYIGFSAARQFSQPFGPTIAVPCTTVYNRILNLTSSWIYQKPWCISTCNGSDLNAAIKAVDADLDELEIRYSWPLSFQVVSVYTPAVAATVAAAAVVVIAILVTATSGGALAGGAAAALIPLMELPSGISITPPCTAPGQLDAIEHTMEVNNFCQYREFGSAWWDHPDVVSARQQFGFDCNSYTHWNSEDWIQGANAFASRCRGPDASAIIRSAVTSTPLALVCPSLRSEDEPTDDCRRNGFDERIVYAFKRNGGMPVLGTPAAVSYPQQACDERGFLNSCAKPYTRYAHPWSNQGAIAQDFQHGSQRSVIVLKNSYEPHAFAVKGPFYETYMQLGGIKSTLGAPIEDTHSCGAIQVQKFERGALRWTAATNRVEVLQGTGEICGNGFDDNYDGQVDEGCFCNPEQTPVQRCYPSNLCDPIASQRPANMCTHGSRCYAGYQRCESEPGRYSSNVGLWSECSGSIGPQQEICGNGLDEDCDGVPDQGCAVQGPAADAPQCACEVGQSQVCYPPEYQRHAGVGICKRGTAQCSVGQTGQGMAFSGCSGYALPEHEADKPECTDYQDNDCDGKTDCADWDCREFTACQCTSTSDQIIELGKPQLMWVVDRSPSMADPIAIASASRWDTMLNALRPLLNGNEADRLDNAVHGGLVVFPDNSPHTACATQTEVRPNRDDNRDSVWDPNSRLIYRTLAAQEMRPGLTLGSGTPTYSALLQAQYGFAGTNKRRFIVLITDGAPNCGNGIDSVVTKIEQLRRPPEGAFDPTPIETFVVGIPGPSAVAGEPSLQELQAALSRMAVAGGRARDTFPQYYEVSTVAHLSNALDTIVSEASSVCTHPLKQTVTHGTELRVWMDDNEIPRHTRAGYSVGPQRNTLLLNGSYCEKLEQGKAQRLTVSFRCIAPTKI